MDDCSRFAYIPLHIICLLLFSTTSSNINKPSWVTMNQHCCSSWISTLPLRTCSRDEGSGTICLLICLFRSSLLLNCLCPVRPALALPSLFSLSVSLYNNCIVYPLLCAWATTLPLLGSCSCSTVSWPSMPVSLKQSARDLYSLITFALNGNLFFCFSVSFSY